MLILAMALVTVSMFEYVFGVTRDISVSLSSSTPQFVGTWQFMKRDKKNPGDESSCFEFVSFSIVVSSALIADDMESPPTV
jgi:hypothetical protein